VKYVSLGVCAKAGTDRKEKSRIKPAHWMVVTLLVRLRNFNAPGS
jgi:hypothetical protein